MCVCVRIRLPYAAVCCRMLPYLYIYVYFTYLCVFVCMRAYARRMRAYPLPYLCVSVPYVRIDLFTHVLSGMSLGLRKFGFLTFRTFAVKPGACGYWAASARVPTAL